METDTISKTSRNFQKLLQPSVNRNSGERGAKAPGIYVQPSDKKLYLNFIPVSKNLSLAHLAVV